MASSSFGTSSGRLLWMMRNLPKSSLSSRSLVFTAQLENVFNLSFSIGSQTEIVDVDSNLSLMKSLKRFWPFSAKWRMSFFASCGTRAEDTKLFSGDGSANGVEMEVQMGCICSEPRLSDGALLHSPLS